MNCILQMTGLHKQGALKPIPVITMMSHAQVKQNQSLYSCYCCIESCSDVVVATAGKQCKNLQFFR